MINAGHGVFSGPDKRLRGKTDDAQEDCAYLRPGIWLACTRLCKTH